MPSFGANTIHISHSQLWESISPLNSCILMPSLSVLLTLTFRRKEKKRNYNVFISVTYLFEDEDMHFVIKPHMSAAAKG